MLLNMLDELVCIEKDLVEIWILIVSLCLLDLDHSRLNQVLLLKEYTIDESHLSVLSRKVVEVIDSHYEACRGIINLGKLLHGWSSLLSLSIWSLLSHWLLLALACKRRRLVEHLLTILKRLRSEFLLTLIHLFSLR